MIEIGNQEFFAAPHLLYCRNWLDMSIIPGTKFQPDEQKKERLYSLKEAMGKKSIGMIQSLKNSLEIIDKILVQKRKEKCTIICI